MFDSWDSKLPIWPTKSKTKDPIVSKDKSNVSVVKSRFQISILLIHHNNMLKKWKQLQTHSLIIAGPVKLNHISFEKQSKKTLGIMTCLNLAPNPGHKISYAFSLSPFNNDITKNIADFRQ